MQSKIDAPSIVRFHERQLGARDWPVMCQATAGPGAWEWIAANHRYNGLLWNEEARVRRLDLPPSEIAAGKRLIGRYRQKCRDTVDAIDRALPAGPAATHLSGASAGAMIDRLSILALRIHHMYLHARRLDAGTEHVQACTGELERLLAQRDELAAGLDALLQAARRAPGPRHTHQ